MNSSMRQLLLADISLNVLPLEGPLCPRDLYTVILEIREHRVAFTEDISKFYQYVKTTDGQVC
jgi:hypothetical protein